MSPDRCGASKHDTGTIRQYSNLQIGSETAEQSEKPWTDTAPPPFSGQQWIFIEKIVLEAFKGTFLFKAVNQAILRTLDVSIKRRKRTLRVDFYRLATCNHRRFEVVVSKVKRQNSEEFDFPTVCIVFLGERAKHIFLFRHGCPSESDDENGFAVNHCLFQFAPEQKSIAALAKQLLLFRRARLV